MKRSHLELYFKSILQKNKMKFKEEYKFHPDRKWRADFFFDDIGLAVEIEGGVWNGRHTKGSGFLADMEKYNALTLLGLRLLRYSNVKQMDEFPEHYKELKRQQSKVRK